MRTWRLVGVAVTACVVALALLTGRAAEAPVVPGPDRQRDPGTSAPTSTRARGDVRRAVAVLRAWDDRRAAAWAASDAAALRQLYVAGSSAGRADLRLLRRWERSGWRVEGLRTQLLSVRVREASARRLVLRVEDRVAGGRMVGGTGRTRVLPATAVTERVLVLRRVGPQWQVARVREA